MTSKALDWAGVLNALAGTTGTPLDPCGAANVWAGLPRGNGLDLVGALNFKNGSWANPLKRLDLAGVCNALAGLSGSSTLDPLGALNYALTNNSQGVEVLASTEYAPGTPTAVQLPTTMTLLDTTNLAVSFTAPASGNVIVTVQLPVAGSTSGRHYYGLYNAAGSVQYGNVQQVLGATLSSLVTFQLTFRVTGLTAGNTYKFCLGGSSSGGSDHINVAAQTIAIGGTPVGTLVQDASAIMCVFAA